MHRLKKLRLHPHQIPRSRCHRWQRAHARQRTVMHGTYGAEVAAPLEINKQRFARYVARVLADARDRGMNDTAIHSATGISPSTFHRWQRADIRTTPDIGKIRAFCDGLGAPLTPALRALGAEEGRDEPAPDPTIDPDVRPILRLLQDPNVSKARKAFVRETLRMLANRTGE